MGGREGREEERVEGEEWRRGEGEKWCRGGGELDRRVEEGRRGGCKGEERGRRKTSDSEEGGRCTVLAEPCSAPVTARWAATPSHTAASPASSCRWRLRDITLRLTFAGFCARRASRSSRGAKRRAAPGEEGGRVSESSCQRAAS